MIKRLRLLFLFWGLVACSKTVNNQVLVYNNDFESGDLSKITNGVISHFNNTAVLGTYNKGSFILSLKELPSHDLIIISFDLYIHDSWDGNKSTPDGPDIWAMAVDGNTYIYTTFSNAVCTTGGFCTPQAYPMDYPNNYNNPRTGAFRNDLPGFCTLAGSSEYKISKTFKHSGNTLVLQCFDKLVQPNAPDQKCDESWSVDNINVKAVTL